MEEKRKARDAEIERKKAEKERKAEEARKKREEAAKNKLKQKEVNFELNLQGNFFLIFKIVPYFIEIF